MLDGEVVVKLADAALDRHAWAASRGLGVRIASPSGWFVATLLEPPAGAKVGDLAQLSKDGQALPGDPDGVLPHKSGKNPLEVVLPELKTDGKGTVQWRGARLMVGGGVVKARIPNGEVK